MCMPVIVPKKSHVLKVSSTFAIFCPPKNDRRQFSNKDKVSNMMWFLSFLVVRTIIFLNLESVFCVAKMKGDKKSLQIIFNFTCLNPEASQIRVTFQTDDIIGKKNRTTNIISGLIDPITPNANIWKANTFGITWRIIIVKMKDLVVNVFWFRFVGEEK